MQFWERARRMKIDLSRINWPRKASLIFYSFPQYFQGKLNEFRENEFGAATVEYIVVAGTMFAVATAAVMRVETKISDLAQTLVGL